jgi:hypothetical protein
MNMRCTLRSERSFSSPRDGAEYVVNALLREVVLIYSVLRCSCCRSDSDNRSIMSSRLIVKNLPPAADEKRVREHFRDQASSGVTDVRVLRTKYSFASTTWVRIIDFMSHICLKDGLVQGGPLSRLRFHWIQDCRASGSFPEIL